jgi:hypothetical protein
MGTAERRKREDLGRRLVKRELTLRKLVGGWDCLRRLAESERMELSVRWGFPWPLVLHGAAI